MVAPKDKTDKLDKSGVVYKIDCQDCDQNYVGETERNLRKRMTEHKRESSPVGAHLHSHHHSFEADNISVLDRDSRWFQRGVKEAIHIAATSPTLNRDRGRHVLPAVYNSLIVAQSHDSGSSRGRVN